MEQSSDATVVRSGRGGRKEATTCDRALLSTCVQEVEKGGPIKGQKVMLEQVAALYNERKPAAEPPLSYTVVRLRIGEWEIPHVTMPQIKRIKRTQRVTPPKE